MKAIYNIDAQETKNFFDNRFFKLSMIFLGLIFTLICASITGLYEKADAVLVNTGLFSAFFVITLLISKCKDNKIIPYFLLQYISVWMFLNQSFFTPLGLDLKLHVVVFGISVLITFYYIFTNFKYLWSCPSFKLLSLFFILNMFYALFYSSDFRASGYIDSWIQGNIGFKHTLLASGAGVATRAFGTEETQFLKYLSGIMPLVAFTVGYMSFFGLKTLDEAKKKLSEVIKLLSFGFLAYCLIMIFSILIGTCQATFVQNRLTIDNSFTGSDFEALLLLLLVGFNIYVSSFSGELLKSKIKYIISIDMLVLALLIILGIKKGTMVSCSVGLIVLTLSYFLFKGKDAVNKVIQSQKNNAFWLLMTVIPVIAVLSFYLLNQDFVSNTLTNISERFNSNDTLIVRETNWYYYLKNWADNLTPFTALFGFGTDASRETSFFLSAMQPDKGLQQPHIHNIYLEYFYNWGLLALLYFLPPLIILCKDISNIMKKSVSQIVKLFSAVSFACIVFFFVYYYAESPAMPSNIMFFALIGFLESLKTAFLKFGDEKQNGSVEISQHA